MKSTITVTILTLCVLALSAGIATAGESGFVLDDFYCGFYTYSLDEETAKKMSEAGFNIAYVKGSISQEKKKAHWHCNEKEWIRSLEAAKKYKIKLVVQAAGDEAYLSSNMTGKQIKEKLLPNAVAFLTKYASEPEFIAYCVKEEPRLKMLDKLRLYYTELRKAAPSVPLFIIHNRLDTALLHPKPYPDITGTDKYCFFYTEWLDLKMPTPRFCLEWFQRRCNQYWLASTFSRKKPMVMVLTGQPVWEKRVSAKQFASLPRKKQQEIAGFVKNGKLGWLHDEKTNTYMRPSWYRAPKNCMRAMSWIAVMEGSKMLFHWSWPRYTEMPEERMFKRGFSLRISDEQFDEFAEACRTFRRFRTIILNMVKERIPLVECDDPFLFHRTHFLKGGKGTIQILVNSDVGTWFDGQKNRFPRQGQYFSIDDKGSLIEYTPAKEKKDYEFSILKNPEDKVWNLLEKKEIKPVYRDGTVIYRVKLEPGGGTFLFTGSITQYNALQLVPHP